MTSYDVIIIGAGPAGLFTAIHCADRNNRVLLLEKNSSAGEKLLLSGSGKCNITHGGSVEDFLNRYGDHGRFMKPALYTFSNEDLLEYFSSRGLRCILNDEGKYFPESLKGRDVLAILLNQYEYSGGELNYNEIVKDIRFDQNSQFKIYTHSTEYSSKILAIAAGGKSYPQTGSTGDGYLFARQLGHTTTDIAPALTPLHIKNYPFKDLSGMSFTNRWISLRKNGKTVRTCCGDIVFTHTGISGPGILNLSRYVLPGDVIEIAFITLSDERIFKEEFMENLENQGKLMIKTILHRYALPKQFISSILTISNISGETQASQVRGTERNRIITLLCAFPMTVEKSGDFAVAMTTRGGVSLDEVNSKTMESRLIPDLYFAGEVLDIDGDTGGYNLQAAFSTGFLAAQSINKKLGRIHHGKKISDR